MFVLIVLFTSSLAPESNASAASEIPPAVPASEWHSEPLQVPCASEVPSTALIASDSQNPTSESTGGFQDLSATENSLLLQGPCAAEVPLIASGNSESTGVLEGPCASDIPDFVQLVYAVSGDPITEIGPFSAESLAELKEQLRYSGPPGIEFRVEHCEEHDDFAPPPNPTRVLKSTSILDDEADRFKKWKGHRGSRNHPNGCRPCLMVGEQCCNGFACSYCHICPSPKRRWNRRRWAETRRAAAWEPLRNSWIRNGAQIHTLYPIDLERLSALIRDGEGNQEGKDNEENGGL